MRKNTRIASSLTIEQRIQPLSPTSSLARRNWSRSPPPWAMLRSLEFLYDQSLCCLSTQLMTCTSNVYSFMLTVAPWPWVNPSTMRRLAECRFSALRVSARTPNEVNCWAREQSMSIILSCLSEANAAQGSFTGCKTYLIRQQFCVNIAGILRRSKRDAISRRW